MCVEFWFIWFLKLSIHNANFQEIRNLGKKHVSRTGKHHARNNEEVNT